jgi:hypothetical protein
MSAPYCVVAYTGTSSEVDGVASVFGPFNSAEADHVARLGNEWANTHPHNRETVVEFRVMPLSAYVGNSFRSVFS